MYLIENPVGVLRVAINRCPRCPSPIEEIDCGASWGCLARWQRMGAADCKPYSATATSTVTYLRSYRCHRYFKENSFLTSLSTCLHGRSLNVLQSSSAATT